ncbi:ATP-dependent RecD-like DNA helicase [Roseicella sp. DB1501]|uniref:ATP-dependent DNA helicase n=1 Tax=Roseicella sp. DB1501 TaxID=2730925 RepID=UPI001C2BF39D
MPWHDTGWTGRVCAAPSANTSCLVLSRIAKGKRSDQDALAGRPFLELEQSELPPCVEERVSFLSEHDIILRKQHPYKIRSPETHGHFGETVLRLEAYSAACVPFGWMLRRQVEGDERGGIVGKADALRLGYDPAREPELPFETSWIQDKHNQLVMLDTFFGALEPQGSLCVFYAKRTPLAEDNRRVIIGVARVTGVGGATEYNYTAPGPLEGVLWERCVRHSLRPGGASDGFLMPYHNLLAGAQADPTLDLASCVAFAPDDQFSAYSYASEHLDDDAAIASLLACAAALRASAERAEVEVGPALKWIDAEIARLWTARGIYPGLGSALSAFGLDLGGLLAHEIVRAGAEEGKVFDAFAFIDAFVADPRRFPQGEQLGFGASFREKWKGLPTDRRRLLELVGRCNLHPAQALRAYQPSIRTFVPAATDADIIANPYIMFERDEAAVDRISFTAIDRGVFPGNAVREAAPLEPPARMADAIDRRRVRALVMDLLEQAVSEAGHTLLPRSWVVRRAHAAPLEPKCAVDEDVLATNADWIKEGLAEARTGSGEPAYKLKRYVASRDMIGSAVRKRVAARRHELAHAWRKLVDAELGQLPANADDRKEEERARQEKAAALELLARSRFSVLIGPAGSGKTTLLKILCDLPQVRDRGVLLLAPTGKARVRLEEATRRLGQGKTLAQFLQGLDRYDGASGRYYWNPAAPREKGYRTVIVDECSMLTEDQLAALLDGIEGVDRLVLVGDPRQLPPIGAGKPFVDICRQLAPPEQPPLFPRLADGYAELTVIGRQRGSGRGDVLLARQFSGEPLDPGADEVWDALAEGTLDHVRAVRWAGPSTVEQTLVAELVSGLQLSGPDDEAGFEQSLGGSSYEGNIYFWAAREVGGEGGAASCSHNWQILSPIRAGLAGVDALNLAVQRRFRVKARAWAEQTRWAKIPKPAGPQGLLWGDKVINVRNNGRRRTYPAQKNAYVANGDIGIVVGGFKRGKMTKRPRHLEVEFNSQPGVQFTYPYWEFSGDDGSPELELAYALTVHKTQGSQFGQTFLVLPKHCRPLTRELLYTALTRQRDQLVILHEDDVGALRRYADPAASEIARRMTDLFQEPLPTEVVTAAGPKFLDQHLLHRTSRNELVRSKAELAIAEKLIAMGVKYVYEQPLVLGGRTRWPDFTIEDDASGIIYYWEHLGLLSDPAYARRWAAKRAAYLAEGVRPIEDAAGADRVLIETGEVEGAGLDMLEVERLARIVLG